MKKIYLIVLAVIIAAMVVTGALQYRNYRSKKYELPLDTSNIETELKKEGERLYREKLYTPLIATYKKLLATLPDNLDLKKKLSFAYFGAGKYKLAFPLLIEVAKTKLADAEVFYELGYILYNDGKVTEAKDNLQRATELDPQHTRAKKLLQKIE